MTQAGHQLDRNTFFPSNLLHSPPELLQPEQAEQHVVHFYDDDNQLADVIARFVADGLLTGEPVIVIATEGRRVALSRALSLRGFDANLAGESGRLILLDAKATLHTFMRDGEPDAALFDETIGGLLTRTLAKTHCTRLRAYGEMVDVLWRSEQRGAAIHLEDLWNRLQEKHRFTLLCAYSMAGFLPQPADMHRVCGTHTHVQTANILTRVSDVVPTVAPPQDREVLERELAQRSEIEGALREALHLLRQREEELNAKEAELRNHQIALTAAYEATLSAHSRAEQLYRFAQAVVTADQLDVVFNAALTSVQAVAGTTRSAILMFDESGKMRFRAWSGLSDAYRDAVDGHSPWAPDATDVAPVLIADALNDPGVAAYADVFRAEGIAALGFIPLVARGRLIGKFMVYYGAPRELTSDEVETVSAIANHLASVTSRFAVVDELKETIRQNELFAGVLAHDLRNPLNAIITTTQLLMLRQERGDLQGSEVDARSFGRILSSGQRMTSMIQELLDVTRARSGSGIGIDPRDTELCELCARAIAELETAHPAWRISMVQKGNVRGLWDTNRMLQVMSNLIANAGQHGTSGEPITVDVDGLATDRVVVSVSNSGAIDPNVLPDIFNPFRRATKGGPAQGLGLGLYIVREIVHAHGGEVTVASADSNTTTVAVSLPRRGSPRAVPGDRPFVVTRRLPG